MDKQALKELVYGGMQELMRNRAYYYRGIGIEYSHWTDAGKSALQEFMDIAAFKMLQAEEAELDKRAKELVVKGLKGERL